MDSAAESDVLSTNSLLNVPKSESGGDSDLTRGDTGSNVSEPPYVCESGNSIGPEPEAIPDSRNTKPVHREVPVPSRNDVANAAGPNSPSTGMKNLPAFGKPVERRTIEAADYKRLDIPENRAICWCCSRKGCWYVEKLTPERKARPRGQQDARRICRSCFETAKDRKRAETSPLPGTISLSSMQRRNPGIGRCSVCDLDPAIWYESEGGVKLCQKCYERERLRQGPIATTPITEGRA